jgi:ATP-binding cassette, subfamily C, bacterial
MMFNKQTIGFIGYFMRAYPGRSALLVFLLVLSGVAEGIGVMTMLPLLDLAANTAAPQESGITQLVNRYLLMLRIPSTVEVLLLLIVLGMVMKAVFTLLAMKQVGYTVARVGTDLRLSLIRSLMEARWAYFVSQPSGHVSNAISAETMRAAGAYRAACALIAAVVQAAMYASIAFLASWRIAVFGVIGGAVIITILTHFVKVSRTAGARQTELTNSLLARLTDALQGIKPIKAMGREQHVQPLLEGETEGLNEVQQKQVLASEAIRSAQEPLLVIMLAGALYFALVVGQQALPAVIVMGFLFYRLAGRISLAQVEYQSLAYGEAALAGFLRQIELADQNREQLSRGSGARPTLDQGIELESVSFSYGNVRVLDQLNLSIPTGSFVALVGPSGAGKTTIADLIIGLHAPDSGTVKVDGTSLADLDQALWRATIGYVPQELLLFHDTVYKNVSLGDPAITRGDVEHALRSAGVWDTIARNPDGLDATLGEGGSKLSGGQRQRVAIARALVRRPRLLVLDEVTTALDPATEAGICRTLAELRGSVTVVAISHQQAIVDVADVVYHLDRGRVTAVRGAGRAEPAASA